MTWKELKEKILAVPEKWDDYPTDLYSDYENRWFHINDILFDDDGKFPGLLTEQPYLYNGK